MDLKDTYNKIAIDWSRDHSNDTWWQEVTNKYISLLKRGGWILDVGCGAGVKSQYFMQNGINVIGIDFSEKMIELARQRNPELEFIVADIREKLNIDKKFDGVFAQAVLLHIPKNEIEGVLKNILEPLKEGGYLYLGVKEKREVEQEILKENDYGYEYERLFIYYTREEIEQLLKKFNLEIFLIESKKLTHTTWLQVIAKK